MIVLSILIGLVGLGIVIVVHELGHFFAAKASGIEVEVFSVGWGKKLLSYTHRGTEYRLSLFPLGGYCRMKGEALLRQAIENDEEKIAHEPGSLFAVHPLKRFITYLAGPTANFVFSIVVLSIVWFVGFSFQSYSAKVLLLSDYPALASQKSYPADQSGLQSGDVITAIDGSPVRSFQDLEQLIAPNPGKLLHVTVKRGSNTVGIEVTPKLDRSTGAGIIGVSPWIEPVVGRVASGSSAAIAGLEPGDLITEVDGKPVRNTLDFASALDKNPPRVQIGYVRDGAPHSASLVLSYPNKSTPTTGISFKAVTFHSPPVGLLGAIGQGASETASTLALTVKSIGLLFKGINLKEAVSGPIRITYYVGEVAQQGFRFGVGEGFANLFRFLSVLSVALFFMNLLPIPALDGGLLVLTLAELVRGKAIRPRFFYRYQVVGFVLIFGLIIMTTLSDVSFLMKQ